MKKYLFLSILLVGTFACKTEFETIRQEGTTQQRYDKAFELYEAGECYKSQVLLESIVANYRGKPEQERIYFHYAKTHYCLENFIEANYNFKNFSRTYTNSKYREEADYLAAYSLYYLSPSYKLEQTYTEKAIDEFQLFINTYPNSDKVKKCNDIIDELRAKLERKAFTNGKLYFDLRRYESAVTVFREMLQDFPDTDYAQDIRYYIVKSFYNYAKNSILSKQEERYQSAINTADIFLKKYPNSNKINEIKEIQLDSKNKLAELKEIF